MEIEDILKKVFLAFVLLIFLNPLIQFVAADGIIIPDPIPREPPVPPLAIKYHHVNISIDNQYAKTDIDQVFLNEFGRDLEGTYIFPLPEEASISEFSMFVDNEELKGEILEKDKARQIYEDIVRRMKDPALLEYVGRNMFKARVYPIPARGEKRIKLEYSEIIKCDSGICKYVYPLETEKFSSKPLEEVVITVKIKSKQSIKTIYSPTHDISVRRTDDNNVEVSYEENNVKPEKDFELYYTISEEDFGLNLLTYKKAEEDGFFMLMLAPKQDISKEKIISKDIIFVIDTSGSMSGKKIEQARNALKFCINSLNGDDKFNIVTFNTDVKKFQDSLIKVNSENIEKANEFIEGIDAGGGTNIHDALLEALKMSDDDQRPNFIVFLTDGLPTVGITEVDKILNDVKDANKKENRIFIFGAGYDVNTHLLDKISGQNKGASEYVKPEEDIELKISNFYSKINNPVLSDLRLEFEGIKSEDMYPKELPDLFRGSQLIIFGRYKGSGNALIKLTGKIGSENYLKEYEVNFPNEDKENFIPRLWATRKIGYLLDEIRLHGEDKELVDEIIELSLRYGIMTPYTSFLVEVDTEYGRPVAMEDARKGFFDSITENLLQAPTGIGGYTAATSTKGLQESEVAESGSERVKFIETKTFYFKDDFWVDNDYSKDMEITNIKYGSDAYFNMLQNYPEVGKYFSLGKRVKFCYSGRCFSIGEKGEDNGEITIPTTTAPTITIPEEKQGILTQTIIIVGIVLLVSLSILILTRRK